MKLDPSRFDDWFRALNSCDPFPWQRRLFLEWLCPPEGVEARWPKLIRLPTATGKTALIDLAVLGLATGSPCCRRRMVFVVDRRIVVDEAALRAHAIANRLLNALRSNQDPLHDVAQSLSSLGGDQPLVVASLRGGIQRDDGWARSPAQAAVVLSTVDQVGSRLLFRAYGGHGPRSWPIHAGLFGRDALIIIDEAHCAVPFCETVQVIADRWQGFAELTVGTGLTVVRTSATPADEADFNLESEDQTNQILRRRLGASKAAELVVVDANQETHRRRLVQEIAGRAEALLSSMTRGVVGVVVNRVADARAIFEQVGVPAERKLLLTGRVRGWERDSLLQDWLPRFRAGSRRESDVPLMVVATQCIEVGANVDFDALVTEAAPLDALRQRFGRLNRLGERATAPAVIVATRRQVEAEPDGRAKSPDAVYGHSLSRAWAWLWARAKGEPRTVDVGIDALEPLLPEGEEMSSLCQEVRGAYPLLPAHLDLLAQTSPPPDPEPEISAFLHGTTKSSPDVTVIWRCDLPEDDWHVWIDRVAVQPPLTGEGCPVPIWEFRRWLGGGCEDSTAEDGGDVEGAASGDEAAAAGRRVLWWRCASDAAVVQPADVTPGSTVVVPCTYGGCDRFGWNPTSVEAVSDIADAVAYEGGGRLVMRLDALSKVLSSVDGAEPKEAADDLKKWAAGEEDAPTPADALSRLSRAANLPGWLRGLASALASDRRCRAVETRGIYAVVGRRGSSEDFSTGEDESSLSEPLPLSDHSAGVRDYAGRFAKAVGLTEPMVSDIALAGWLHDVGKADPRFQVWLHGGDEVSAALADVPLAKSGQTARNCPAIRRARERAHYPLGGRHEVQSLALIADQEYIRQQAHDWDLVQHLVASHHGFARPFVPVVSDPEPVTVAVTHGALRLSQRSDHSLHRMDSGIAERYWRLVRRYGWWGLAWLEAILRLADHRRSEDEERGEAKRV